MFQTFDPHWSRELVIQPVSRQVAVEPRLSLERIGTVRVFFSSLAALIRGPLAPKEFLGEPFFRDCWIERKFPKSSFVAAIILQALLIRFPPPIWNLQGARNSIPDFQRSELTWYGPIKDFPLIAPKPVHRKEVVKPQPRPATDAFHPRQTILSEPLHPTHPRQTLVQPKAPQEPPKILPALPNIVQLAASEPARPKAQLTASQLVALRPKTPASIAAANVQAPEFADPAKQAGAIDIASSYQRDLKPALPVNSMSAPRAARQRTDANGAAPEIAAREAAGETIIALSATPAPVAPPPVMPVGNLSARVSISPDSSKSGGHGGAPSSPGASRGPDGIYISGGNGTNKGPVSDLGVGSASRGAGNPLPATATARLRSAPEGSNPLSSEAIAAAAASPKLGMAPQDVLSGKRVYTLHVNMPNLTSATGSWILNFAELNGSTQAASTTDDGANLATPAPLRKVDPKYPPELRSAHVDGEVILYAIIRKDGSVDSIQLVKSIDPRLDANAMEALAQWKFLPAERHGEPVDLEAVIHIPFRSRPPAF